MVSIFKNYFPSEGKVIPLLRDSSIKYKKPAINDIEAFATCSEENINKFTEQFFKKGRASLEVKVLIKDIDGTCTA